MKRNIAVVLIIISLVGLALPLIGCGSGQGEVVAQASQTATVQRGDLTIDISAAGNLALANTADLAIELFYGQSGSSGTKGTIGEVLVEEGDTVEEGQELVKLDTDEWNDELSTLEKALAKVQRDLTAKESALTAAERKVTTLEREVTAKEDAVTKAEHQVTAKEFAVRKAKVDMETTEYNLSQIDDVKEAQDAVDDAEYEAKFYQSMMTWNLGHGAELTDYTYWSDLKSQAEEQLAQAQQDLQDILDGNNMTLSDDVALQVAKYQLLVTESQMALEDAQIAVDDAKQAVADTQIAVDDAKYAVKEAQLALGNAKLDLEDAKQAVADAQSDLDEAKSLSPVITAPFAGFVTKVNVEGGDEVMKGTVAVQIADPNKFEAYISVSEMDIKQVKLGGDAEVQVDSLSGLILPAKVAHIAPTATIQSGVVNYKVRVEVQSLEAAAQAASGQTSATEDLQLREGLTVTVSIIVAERQNVLLVPNAAITSEGGQRYVQVLSTTGTTEKRAIKTGVTDYTNTEVTEGLNEGEKVIIPQSTKKTTTTTQQQPGGIMMPGVGGGGPPPGG
jgi:HlyD family secretion protein